MLVRRHVRSEEWHPIGVDELESNALDVVRSINNRSVIAGPGAGKTELLAQRAAYLLQTGISEDPRRILALSYKRDAARNLAARVRSRCHPDLAHRFDSQTCDAFAKSLVDRFGQALPQRFRPTPDYEIAYPTDAILNNFLQKLRPPKEIGSYADIVAISVRTFEKRLVVPEPLVDADLASPTPGQWAAAEFWKAWLHGEKRSFLSFPMIGRLAELLIRTNPLVREALRLSYSHLFMDEFQDTTQVQYDLVKSIFMGSATVLTCVGDNKQQIMRWAMAMDDAFGVYEVDFAAQRTPLFNNYRSSPDLVRIQNILAKALDNKAIEPVSKNECTIVGNSCEVWDFSNPKVEASTLADFVVNEMMKYELSPRDFALVVRVRAAQFFKELEPAFAKRGIVLRNEAAIVGPLALQELLAEDFSELLVMLLRLLSSNRAGKHWTDCIEMLCFLRSLDADDDKGCAQASRDLNDLSGKFSAKFAKPVTTALEAKALVQFIFDFVGRLNLLAISPAYRQGDWLAKVMEAAAAHLEESCKGAASWSEALDRYEGLRAVPLMTVHKSKGLEYHTVIFVGLEDSSLFSFLREKYEETAGFFVAFTRAKQRVVFTYCDSRGNRNEIAPLYKLLTDAGVRTIRKG